MNFNFSYYFFTNHWFTDIRITPTQYIVSDGHFALHAHTIRIPWPSVEATTRVLGNIISTQNYYSPLTKQSCARPARILISAATPFRNVQLECINVLRRIFSSFLRRHFLFLVHPNKSTKVRSDTTTRHALHCISSPFSTAHPHTQSSTRGGRENSRSMIWF